MSSSVITQQSTGLATETQNGLVSTGTQSFAGNKTFTGTNVIVNGNIGVGTASPGAKLDVNGAAIIGPTTGSVTHVFRNAATTLPSNITNTTCVFTNRTSGTASTALGWISASFGAPDKTANNIVIGSANGHTYIGGHNPNLTDWETVRIRSLGATEHWRTNAELVAWRSGAENATIDGAYVIYNRGGVGMYIAWGATAWTANSDERMKKNIQPLELGLEQINALKPARFDYNSDESDNSSRVGFIAQEVLPVLPHAVVVPEDSEKMMGVSATEMIPVLVKAIQELSAKNDELAARLSALESNNG